MKLVALMVEKMVEVTVVKSVACLEVLKVDQMVGKSARSSVLKLVETTAVYWAVKWVAWKAE